MDTSNWKLIRAIYNYDRTVFIEGDYPEERFIEALEEGREDDVCWIIGTEIPSDTIQGVTPGHTCVRVELEGSKENLEHVLSTVNGVKSILNIQLFKEAGILPEIHAHEEDDESVMVEWIFPGFRVGLNIEKDKKESGWHVVSKQITASEPLYEVVE